jgi:hypothetical protein
MVTVTDSDDRPMRCMLSVTAQTEGLERQHMSDLPPALTHHSTWKYGLCVVLFALYSYEHSRVFIPYVPSHNLLLVVVSKVKDGGVQPEGSCIKYR